MNELEELRRQKLEQLKNEQLNALKEQQQALQQISAMESVVYNYMTPEALSRYGNLKVAHLEKAVKVLTMLYQAVTSGALKHKISDNELKDLLIRLDGPKKEFNIKFR